LRTIVMNYFL